MRIALLILAIAGGPVMAHDGHGKESADHRMDTMKDGEIYWVVTNGVAKAMPGFEAQLSDTERWQIVAHLRRLRKRQ